MKKSTFFLFLSIVSLSLIVLLLGPADTLEICSFGGQPAVLFRSPVPLGQACVTIYIHSVQKTPVEDEYIIQGQKLWQWEERFVSHNAGLPVDVPRNATFRENEDWMVIRGGRASFSPLLYRVGSSLLGRNILLLPNYGTWSLYALFPEERLIFRVEREPLLWGLTRVQNPD